MKKSFAIPILLAIAVSFPVQSQQRKSKKPPKPGVSAPKLRPSSATSNNEAMGAELAQALKLIKDGNFEKSSELLFRLSLSPKYANQRLQIRYLLGFALFKLELYQVSAFHFINVVRMGNNRYVSPSLEKLSVAADILNDETLLNYAISRIKIEDFPLSHKDQLFYRVGEYQMRMKQYSQAVQSFSRVSPKSGLHSRAKYMEGLSYAELPNLPKALETFQELIDSRMGNFPTDKAKVLGLMGRARTFYQNKQWDEALEAYREIPRDSLEWHDTLFEMSWAMLRSGRFRSAVSQFQSLHSPFYEDFYIPESLLLRSIVYLYICKYSEMEKTLNHFVRVYQPAFKKLTDYLKTEPKVEKVFSEIALAFEDRDQKSEEIDRSKYKIPYLLASKVSRFGDVQRSYDYIGKLQEEMDRFEKLPTSWKQSSLGKYSLKILQTRTQKATQRMGRQSLRHLQGLRAELLDLFEQEGFLRYEMINGRKEVLKQKVSGKGLPEINPDKIQERDYFVKNGYQYWPFKGEYWLDELGSYNYVGTSSCK